MVPYNPSVIDRTTGDSTVNDFAQTPGHESDARFGNADAPASPAGPVAVQLTAAEERNWAMAAHLTALVGIVVPGGNIVAPLIVWLVKREQSAFVDRHARESLNFNITTSIYVVALSVIAFLCFLLSFLCVTVPLGVLAVVGGTAVSVGWIVFTIVGGVRAARGAEMVYPMNIRFV